MARYMYILSVVAVDFLELKCERGLLYTNSSEWHAFFTPYVIGIDSFNALTMDKMLFLSYNRQNESGIPLQLLMWTDKSIIHVDYYLFC